MELLLILMMIHSPIQCSLCLLSWILRSICQTSHTLCMLLFLIVLNPVTSRMFAYPNQVLLVSSKLSYLIPCAFAAPPLFLALILRSSLNIFNITLFPPYILLPQRILYHFMLQKMIYFLFMSLHMFLYVLFWIPWKIDQSMESLRLCSLILSLILFPT